LVTVLTDAGYSVGAMTIDAAAFLPQSRPRVFVIATRGAVPPHLRSSAPGPFHSTALIEAASALPAKAKRAWVWWRLSEPGARNTALNDLLEPDEDVVWRSKEDTNRVLSLMSPRQRSHVETLRASGARHVGAAFRRMRREAGEKVQRVEARFDGLAGCLRTPAGGSSRQTLLAVESGKIRSRLLLPRECARLMGLGDDYPLPASTTAALHLMGDAVAVPVVRWLGEHLLAPLVAASRKTKRAA
jgi:DNA (cytosine-5)-methyltransferase 1